MQIDIGEFIISDDSGLIQVERVHQLLGKTYWANARTKEKVKNTIDHSLCFGVYRDGIQVGFARCVTDYTTMYWLGDVIIDEEYRGKGLGKALIKAITEHQLLCELAGTLRTKDAHGLYAQYGFCHDHTYMRRNPSSII